MADAKQYERSDTRQTTFHLHLFGPKEPQQYTASAAGTATILTSFDERQVIFTKEPGTRTLRNVTRQRLAQSRGGSECHTRQYFLRERTLFHQIL